MLKPDLVRGLAWIMLAIVCWAPMFSVAKRVLPHMDAFALASVRYAFGVVLFAITLAFVEGAHALRFGGRLPQAIVVGLVGITGFNVLVWYGLNFSRPEHASIIMAMQTPLTALAAWIVRGQRPAGFTIGCIAAAIGGVLLVVTRGDPVAAMADLGTGGALLGDMLILLGAVCWVIYTMSAATFTGWSPLRFTTLTCMPGAVGLFAVHALAIGTGVAVVPDATAFHAVWPQLVYFVFGTVFLGVLSFNAGVQHLGPLNTMLMLNLIPVSVFAIEAALGRSFAAVEIAGAAIVIAALAANNVYLRLRLRVATAPG